MSDLEHPWGRVEVLDGLRVMVDLKPGTPERDWEFTEAVHGFSDDTWWDEGDPSKDIGRILVNEAEADSARIAGRDLIVVLRALGPDAPYDDYLCHPGWDAARDSMKALLDLMEASG